MEDPDVFVIPSVESVTNGTYLISRNLYMYTPDAPTGIIKEYINWIHSSEAQKIVAELGFVPILSE